jgi:hypothetical protein
MKLIRVNYFHFFVCLFVFLFFFFNQMGYETSLLNMQTMWFHELSTPISKTLEDTLCVGVRCKLYTVHANIMEQFHFQERYISVIITFLHLYYSIQYLKTNKMCSYSRKFPCLYDFGLGNPVMFPCSSLRQLTPKPWRFIWNTQCRYARVPCLLCLNLSSDLEVYKFIIRYVWGGVYSDS